jgi:hypothetical protein
MSTALAVAAATEAMRKVLENWLRDTDVNAALDGGQATVSAVPPDQLSVRGPNAKLGLNLYLHRVTLNQGWRNVGLPSRDSAGQRIDNPPLPVDLHFVLSAYGTKELQPETLLGHGMQAFQHHPILTRGQLKALLRPELAASGLAGQIEQLRIVPESIVGQEASELWSSFQATYRPSFYYGVSVVLIEDATPTRASMPVLTRGERVPSVQEEPGDVPRREAGAAVTPDLAPRYPVLTTLRPQGNQPVAIAGRQVSVEGELLTGAQRVRLVDHRFVRTAQVNIPPPDTPRQFTFTLPATVAVGTYDLTVEVQRTTNAAVQTTNRLPLTVAPRITNLPATVPVVGTSATVTIDCVPSVQAGQQVSLILGTREIALRSPSSPTGQLQFQVRDAQVGAYLARLRVDGIESILIDRTKKPPAFDTSMTVTIQ